MPVLPFKSMAKVVTFFELLVAHVGNARIMAVAYKPYCSLTLGTMLWRGCAPKSEIGLSVDEIGLWGELRGQCSRGCTHEAAAASPS